MGKNKKQKNKKYAMNVDGEAQTEHKGKGAEFMAIDKPPKQQARDPLAVKLKPKRGKSSRKQKQRMALKLDKALATSDRSNAKTQKRSQKSSQKQSLKHLWSTKDSAPSLTQ
ncbi:g2000 [Coccomyxa viridis]|uniref:G2000 protein n=1 Tax=Coccomyxa viridis TaxID=1274662 RepID=A0ABP1FN67_9CHLO